MLNLLCFFGRHKWTVQWGSKYCIWMVEMCPIPKCSDLGHFECTVGNEYWTSLVFRWSKVVLSSNGLIFRLSFKWWSKYRTTTWKPDIWIPDKKKLVIQMFQLFSLYFRSPMKSYLGDQKRLKSWHFWYLSIQFSSCIRIQSWGTNLFGIQMFLDFVSPTVYKG